MSEESRKPGIRLSSAGMQRVCQHDREKFRFIVDGREYECGLHEACFVSPTVSCLLSSDRTLDHLHLNICCSSSVCKIGACFEKIFHLGEGASIEL